MENKEILKPYFRAAYPAISIATIEERRALLHIKSEVFDLDEDGKPKEDTKGLFEQILLWDPKNGLRNIITGQEFADTQQLFEVLKEVIENTLYIFTEIHMMPLSEDPVLNRYFRDFIDKCPAKSSCTIFLSPHFEPPTEWERSVVPIDFPLPDRGDLEKILDSISKSAKESGKKEILLTNGNRDSVISAARGMGTDEAANAFALSLVKSDYEDITAESVHQEKISAINRSGILDYIDTTKYTLDNIGGLDALKEFWLIRKNSLGKAARKFGCSALKGVIILGVPGTGKSLTAKTVGTILGLPTLRLDVGKLFGSLVGQSEAQTRKMIQIAEACAPVVLWIDEIEKAFAGSGSSGEHDSGVTARMVGSLLTWFEEINPANPVIKVATANNLSILPPELLRKGRWDEIFAVDLPTKKERGVIFEIHLRKRNRDPKDFDINYLAGKTHDFTGSEIEEVVKASLFYAFNEGKGDLKTKHMLKEITSVKPIAITMKNQIDVIRKWIGERARNASYEDIETRTSTKTRQMK